MTKIKTIKLTDGHAPNDRRVNELMQLRRDGRSEEYHKAEWEASRRFRVEQITDSIEFHTGQMLEREEVQSLCESKEWKVTIAAVRS